MTAVCRPRRGEERQREKRERAFPGKLKHNVHSKGLHISDSFVCFWVQYLRVDQARDGCELSFPRRCCGVQKRERVRA